MQQTSDVYQQYFLLRIPAKIISYIFHPLFIPTYIFLFLVYQFPYEFSGIDLLQLKLRVFNVFFVTAFLPAFAVFLLWRLKFSESIFLRTQKERVIPYVITMFFYWWMYYLSRTFTDQPIVLKFFYFGIFISTSIGVIINNYIKISLHGMAMGGALTAIILFSYYYHSPMFPIIMAAVLFTGLVCSARLTVSNHTPTEIIVGLTVGILCQIAAYNFIL